MKSRRIAFSNVFSNICFRPGLRRRYWQAGGQPGHAAGWEDEVANAAMLGFYRNTRRARGTTATCSSRRRRRSASTGP